MIPKEIQEINQWSYSFSIEQLKRPKHSHYSPNGSLSFNQAVTVAKQKRFSFGFYTTLKDPYVIGDIDHIADPNDPSTLHPAITNLLMNKKMYSEISPSGEGIRFVAKLPSVQEKEKLRGKIFYTRFPLKNKREAQINVAPPWLRFTGNVTKYSADNIPTITFDEWSEAFKLKFKTDDLLAEMEEGVPHGTPDEENARVPELTEIKMALDACPLDQTPRIIRSYEKVFKQAYSHYDFWLRIIMGIHDYATKTGRMMDCLTMIVDWSKTDPEAYEGEDDIITKWESLSRKDENVSYHTVFAIAYANTLVWPMPKALTKEQMAKGVTKRSPINSEYRNFRAMTEFYNITLHQDVNSPAKMFISGDIDIMKQFFESHHSKYYYEKYRGIFSEKHLVSAFHIMCQQMHFTGVSHQQVQQHIRDWVFQVRNTIDLVKLYFDTPFEDLPESYQDNKENIENSTIEFMFGCLKLEFLTEDQLKESKLYFKYYKSWLMGMVRSLYWPNDPHMNNCVLLLTGREQIRKTSHFNYMLPKFMREERIAFTTHGFKSEASMRDLIKLAAGNSLLVWDEIEQYLTSETESNFKKLIDSNPTKFIDKYDTIETRYKPVAMFGATSNQAEFKLSDTGSRRLFHIPVSWVDTDSLDKVCWWRIVNDLKDEIAKHKGTDPPWLLNKEQLAYQSTLHSRITAKSGLEIIIHEIFNFYDPCPLPKKGLQIPNCTPLKDPNFMSTRKVIDMIRLHTHDNVPIKRAQLVRILHNLCGDWTGTRSTRRIFVKPKLTMHRGLCSYSGQHQLWYVPVPVNPYDKEN